MPIVISEAEGVWVKDPEGNKYMDMLSAYSAVNQGHRHPKIIQALKDQADKVTLVSRAFHSDNLGEWYEKICKLAGKDKALPMNTGAEAVETALKAARRGHTMLKELSQIKQKSLHLMVTSMVEQWRQFHYLQKQNTTWLWSVIRWI